MMRFNYRRPSQARFYTVSLSTSKPYRPDASALKLRRMARRTMEGNPGTFRNIREADGMFEGLERSLVVEVHADSYKDAVEKVRRIDERFKLDQDSIWMTRGPIPTPQRLPYTVKQESMVRGLRPGVWEADFKTISFKEPGGFRDFFTTVDGVSFSAN